MDAHWLATPPDPEPDSQPVSVVSNLTVAGLRATGWTVTGPYVHADAYEAAVERIGVLDRENARLAVLVMEALGDDLPGGDSA